MFYESRKTRVYSTPTLNSKNPFFSRIFAVLATVGDK